MTAVSWNQGRLAAFDIETTGTDVEHDRIVTAAISLIGGGADPSSHDWLVDPGIEIPAEATAVHRITTARARQEGMPARQAVEEISRLLAEQVADDVPIVAFNARFDLTILDREARRHGVDSLTDRVGPGGLTVIDPYILDWHLNRYRPGRRTLGVLCEIYRVPLTDAHAADADALAAARLAWRIANGYPEIGEAEPFELHESQMTWAAERADSLQEYFDRQGREERVERAWPVVPLPPDAASLDTRNALAA